MADRVSLSIGVLAVVGVAAVYFVLDSRLSKLEAKAAAEEADRTQFVNDPAKFVQCQAVQFAPSDFKKGGFGNRVTEATLKNTSAFTVVDIRGNVEYRKGGNLVATVPATASGLLLPDRAALVQITADSITTSADEKETVFVVTSAAIVGGR